MSKFTFIFFAFLMALISYVHGFSAENYETCEFTDDKLGTTFDLSPLQSATGFVILQGNTRYYFSICRNVPKPDPSCTVETSPAYAVTTVDSKTTCEAFSGATWTKDVSWTLLNKRNPKVRSQGMALTYKNPEGDCPGGLSDGSNSLTINLVCNTDNTPNIPEITHDGKCNFSLELRTPLACPVQCPLGTENRHLCSAQGICAFDRLEQTSRCLCNGDFGGVDCAHVPDTTTKEPTCDGACAALAVVFVMLLALSCFVGFVAFKLYKYRNPHTTMDIDQSSLVNIA